MSSTMNIKLTDAAKKELDRIMDDGKLLRITLERAGCCGYSFSFYADQKRTGDEIVKIEGYDILITKAEKSLMPFVKELDFGRHGLLRNFRAVMK